jgi:hypothetical protein
MRICFLIIIFAALILLRQFLFITDGHEILAIGSSVPTIPFIDHMGNIKELKNEEVLFVIIFFNLECEHCLYQLNIINEGFDRFNGTRMFFLTNDKNIFRESKLQQWDRLTVSKDVTFGIINRHEFGLVFGKLVLPTVFIFNAMGELVKKIYGEVKLERILAEISFAGGLKN